MTAVKYSKHLDPREEPTLLYPANEIPNMTGTIVEIGPGRGDFLFHLAKENPKKTVYGIEIKSKRFLKLIDRREKRELFNVRLVQADAKIAVPELFEAASVDAIYINFPDPWPKKRHAKNRLLRTEFLGECVQVLKQGGLLYFTTDVDWYANETFELISKNNSLKSVFEGVKNESDEAYPTLFAEKWIKMGRTIHYQKHMRV